jgi:hypothetical protein
MSMHIAIIYNCDRFLVLEEGECRLHSSGMLHRYFSCGLLYNAVIISDYMLLIMGLVNWEGSGSTCGLSKVHAWKA